MSDTKPPEYSASDPQPSTQPAYAPPSQEQPPQPGQYDQQQPPSQQPPGQYDQQQPPSQQPPGQYDQQQQPPPTQGYGQPPPQQTYGQPQQPYYGQPQAPQYAQPYQQQSAQTVIFTQPMGTAHLASYGPSPCTITCPHCNANVTTSTSKSCGGFVWMIAGIICLIGCFVPFVWLGCCLIPFCVPSLYDVHHSCPNCQRQLSTYKRGF